MIVSRTLKEVFNQESTRVAFCLVGLYFFLHITPMLFAPMLDSIYSDEPQNLLSLSKFCWDMEESIASLMVTMLEESGQDSTTRIYQFCNII